MNKYALSLAVLTFVVTGSMSAFAQDAREAQLIGFRDFCEKGDKKACVKFGMMLQQNADRHAEWRRNHPDWFFFEH